MKFLKSSYPVDKHLFLIPRLSLRAIGFYPETELNVWVKLWAFFNIAILGYGCYAELYYGIYYLPIDMSNALDALCPVASSILSFIKISFIWWYRDEFKHLIREVRRLTNAQNSPGKTDVKRQYYITATRLNALVWFFSFSCSSSYTIRTIITNTMLYLDGKDILYITPFKMMFPDALLSMPLYPWTYLLVHWHGYITCLAFVGADGIFLGFCFYFTVLLIALRQDLINILDDAKKCRTVKNRTESEICLELTKIIERHNEIADLTVKFSSVIVVLTLSHFITSSLVIGTSVIDILLLSGYGIVVYVVHTCAVFCEIFLYCVGGQALRNSSEELARTVYNSQWYTHSVKVQKMVLLIMIRAQTAITVKIPFFEPSLPALAAILRFTGSVIAWVKTFI